MGVKVRQKDGGDAWWVFINYKGIRKSRLIGEKKAAEVAAAKYQVQLAEGDTSLLAAQPGAELVTFEVYADRCLTDAEATLKPATLRFYKMNLRLHINPVLGPLPIGSLRRSHCREVIRAAREKGLKPKSLEGVARTMSTVLSHAVEDELLPANPAFRLGRHIGRKGKSRASEIEPFTREEASTFLLAVKGHMPDYYALFLCALRTGLRLGELIALEWDDVDFHGGFLNVRRSRSAGVEGTPKNGKARRVDLSTQLAEELQRLLVTRKAQKLANGWKALPAKVFCAAEGGPLDGDNVRTRVFYEVLKKTKGTVRRVRFHDLRHTFASLLIQNGESLVYVKEQLGHSSIQVTVDIYGHLIPGANRQAVDRLDEPVAPPTSKGTQTA
jgi:integrase